MRKNGHIEDNILNSKCPKKRICVKKDLANVQKNAYSVKKGQ